jgi:hypothetical protein
MQNEVIRPAPNWGDANATRNTQAQRQWRFDLAQSEQGRLLNKTAGQPIAAPAAASKLRC